MTLGGALLKSPQRHGQEWRISIGIEPFIHSRRPGNYLHAVAFSIQPMICFWSAFVPLVQVLGHRLEIRSQFGKGLLYVNVAGRVCELQTFFGLLEICLRRQHDGTKRS
jgi:hypothetical protein